MKPIDPDGFEAMFQKDADPWNYAASPFEAFKRRELLRACGARQYGRALELACANGETSRHLVKRCLTLLAVDASPTVIDAARARVQAPGLTFANAILPAEAPRGPFDLIVVSELLYYMTERDMLDLIDRVVHALAPGGRLVLVHHTVGFGDAAQPPWLAQSRAKGRLMLDLRLRWRRKFRQFEVLALDKLHPLRETPFPRPFSPST